jgi:hypothetical protein
LAIRFSSGDAETAAPAAAAEFLPWRQCKCVVAFREFYRIVGRFARLELNVTSSSSRRREECDGHELFLKDFVIFVFIVSS